MPNPHSDTDQLILRVADGDSTAAHTLLTRCRPRLHRMVGVHMDQRVSSRVDPSDVVQETLAEAIQRLPEYVQQQSVSFYPWLRRIAWQRLMKLHRSHVRSARRTVGREEYQGHVMLEDSVQQLVNHLAASGTEPGQRMVKQEIHQRVRNALQELSPDDRSMLVMRYLEHMSIKEISEVVEISLSAARKRHTRALERLQRLLCDLT